MRVQEIKNQLVDAAWGAHALLQIYLLLLVGSTVLPLENASYKLRACSELKSFWWPSGSSLSWGLPAAYLCLLLFGRQTCMLLQPGQGLISNSGDF